MSSLEQRPPARRRRLIYLALAGVAVLAVPTTWVATHQRAGAVTTPSGWTTTFTDDFSGGAGTGLDRANWLYDLGTSYPGGAANWGTGEIETMTDSTANVYQDGAGHLVIKPIRDGSGHWTSGRVETQRTDFGAPAGGKVRIEAAIQQPDVSGAAAAGYWPAFWALGQAARGTGATGWPSIGEWDILEDINGRSSLFATLHCGSNPGGPCNETTGIGSGERPCGGCQTAFHTYAVEYDRTVSPEQLRFYLDGSNYFTVNSTQVDATTWNNATHHGMFVILNVAIGGGFPSAFGGGPTAATQSGVPMLVDYVAVFNAGAGAPTATTKPPTTSATPTTPPTGSCSAAAWNAATAYNGGAVVSYGGHSWTAKWWTQGEQPDLNAGDGKVWTDNGACGGGTPTTAAPTTQAPPPTTAAPTTAPAGGTWVANHAYGAGDVVSYGGRSYRCLQAHTSLVGWEPPNVPALWQAT